MVQALHDLAQVVCGPHLLIRRRVPVVHQRFDEGRTAIVRIGLSGTAVDADGPADDAQLLFGQFQARRDFRLGRRMSVQVFQLGRRARHLLSSSTMYEGSRTVLPVFTTARFIDCLIQKQA